VEILLRLLVLLLPFDVALDVVLTTVLLSLVLLQLKMLPLLLLLTLSELQQL
jgi:hypothetical protein